MEGQNVFNLFTKIYKLRTYINRDAYFIGPFGFHITGLDIIQCSTEEELQERMIRKADAAFERLKERIRNKEPLHQELDY